LPNKKIGK